MLYKSLQGSERHGDLWCEGPLDKTVWVLASPRPVVVRIDPKGSNREIEYDWPTLPTIRNPSAAQCDRAARVVRSYRYRRDPYLHRYGFDGECLDPSLAEFLAAQALLQLDHQLDLARRNLMAHKHTRVSISAKRMREINAFEL